MTTKDGAGKAFHWAEGHTAILALVLLGIVAGVSIIWSNPVAFGSALIGAFGWYKNARKA